ncbi:MAG: hypothetical protein IJW36_00945, partial [Clostridia bacterium]|nr:hypothetical protein [Clostridia bacterium]
QLMNGQTAVTGVYYIDAPAAATAGTAYDVCTDVKFYGFSQSTTEDVGSLMGDTITVSIESKSIQQISEETGSIFATPYDAYTALGAFAA